MAFGSSKRFKLGDYRPDFRGTQALAAEGLGTFMLVLAAAGAASPLAAGLTLMVLVLLFGPVSGAAFNPAVALGYAVAGRLPKGRLLPYVLVQCLGALAAALALRALLRADSVGVNSTQMPGLAALLLEALCTAWLVWVVLAANEKGVPLLHTGVAIGGALAAAGIWAGPLSGASLNPARSLGPALAALDFAGLWIYLAGPLLGGWIGALAYGRLKSLR